MKAFTAFALACMIISVSIFASPVIVYGEASVGVKEGDWIEYNVSMAGVGAMPPTHDVRWFRIEVLPPVEDSAFSVSLTSRYANGTVGSAIWRFNFTEGNVEGWIIIPANLSAGDTFYDYSLHTGVPVNVTIQSEEQKNVFGATRTITYGQDALRHKEWDKATGVFIGTTEYYKNVTTRTGWHIEDLTVTVTAAATNMWSPALIMGLKPSVFYALVTVVAALVALMLAFVILDRKKKLKTPSLSSSWQGKLAVLTIVMVVVFEVASMFLFPFYAVGLSSAEINLVMQTVWTGLVFMSMWFRTKGNYFMHEITMLIVISAWWIGVSFVLLMDPFSSSTEVFSNTPLRLVMNALHGIFSIPALIFGTWLAAVWRPESPTFPAKTKRLAQLTLLCWIPSYVVGFLDFLVLHTAIFG
jgi:hypothetical protein